MQRRVSGWDTGRTEINGHDTQYGGLTKRDLVGKSDSLGSGKEYRKR